MMDVTIHDLDTVMLSPEVLKPYENNAKKHTKKQIEHIANSIREFGFNDNVGVWTNDKGEYEIVTGHGTVEAAKMLGLPEIPCDILDHLSDTERRAYCHVHNQTSLETGFDYDTLTEDMDNLDVDFADFGFEAYTYDDVEDTGIPDEPEEPVTRRGDVIMLGDHRLMCGDSTSPDDVAELMDGCTADICFTSPPYGAGESANLRNHQEAGHHIDDGTTFYGTAADEAGGWRGLMDGFFGIARTVSDMQFVNVALLTDNKAELARFVGDNADALCDVIVWNNHTSPPQINENVLNNLVEFVFVFGDGTRSIRYGDFKGNRPNYIETDREVNQYASEHGAVFPVSFASEIIGLNAKAKTIYDPFGGSGTTLIAAEQLNRCCYMMELSEGYCDIIVKRWEELTGRKASR